MSTESYVIDRHGNKINVEFDNITKRNKALCLNYGEPLTTIDPIQITVYVVQKFVSGITTRELDHLSIQYCNDNCSSNEEYEYLAARIAITGDIHKETSECIKESTKSLVEYGYNEFSEEYIELINKYYKLINEQIDHTRDFNFKYFGYTTLLRYLKKSDNSHYIERPQHAYMRVALILFCESVNQDSHLNESDITDALHKSFEFYHSLSTQKLSVASPILLNSGTKRQQMSSCFTADTEVFTINNGITQISKINIGDEVVTHTGEIQKVTYIHKNHLNDRKLYELVMEITPPIKVTENHKLRAIKRDNLRRNDDNPEWIAVSDLKFGDYIMIPNKNHGITEDVWDILEFLKNIKSDNGGSFKYNIIDESKLQLEVTYTMTGPQFGGKTIECTHKRGNLINKNWHINENFAWFLGVWFGDGCVTNAKNRKGIKVPQNIQITTGINDTITISKLIGISKKIFGVSPTVHLAKKGTWVQLIWNSRLLAIIFQELFGHGFDGKHLHPLMFQWDKKLVTAFLGGLITSDGCVASNGTISISLCNYNLSKSVYHLTRSVGTPSSFSLNKRTHKEDYTGSKSYTIGILNTESVMKYVHKYYKDNRLSLRRECNQNKDFIEINNNTYVKIKDKILIEEDLPEYVYTLTVDVDHSYNVEGIVCENCLLLPTGDDLSTLMDVYKDTAMLSKWAAGIGIWLTSIRAEGAKIGNVGRATGIKHYVKMLNELQIYVNQRGLRPGAFAMYLEPWHADIFTFLEVLPNKHGHHFNAADLKYALYMPDNFLRALQNDSNYYLFSPDEAVGLYNNHSDKFEELYDHYTKLGKEGKLNIFKEVKASDILRSLFVILKQVGNPYLLFKDTINKLSNMQNVATICSSNLCVSGDTHIMTSQGQIPIKNRVGKLTDIWNGSLWSTVMVQQTGVNQKLIRVRFNDGSYLDCTEYHKFYDIEGNELRAGELKIGQEIEKLTNYEAITAGIQDYNAEELGRQNSAKFTQIDLTIPLEYDYNSRVKWLNGVFDRQSIESQLNTRLMTWNDTNYIKMFLQSLGAEFYIEKFTPDNHKGAQTLYYIHINPNSINGFITNFTNYTYIHKEIPLKVSSIQNLEKNNNTYCFNEPEKHRGVFNGLLTGNCSEITIPSWTKFDSVRLFNQPKEQSEYGVCNLGAVCLGKYVKYNKVDYHGIATSVEKLVEALDNTIDINYYPAEAGRNSNMRHRPIGIGILGLADIFQQLGVSFGSKAARDIDMSIAATIYYSAMKKSSDLARERGSYESYTFRDGAPALHGLLQPDLHVKHGYLKENWEVIIENLTNGYIKVDDWNSLRTSLKDGYLRNAYLTAYMPTASTANIVSQNENFEPITSNIYKRTTMSGQYLIVNKYLLKELKENNIWSESIRLKIIRDNGSVQNISEIPELIRKKYKTVRETKQEAIIAHAKVRGAFICQTQSMNLYPKDLSMQQLRDLLLFSWQLGIKTASYYTYSQAALGNVVAGAVEHQEDKEEPILACSRDNPNCEACAL